MKVLVADHNPLIREVLRQVLETGGWSAEYVEDGAAAVSFLMDAQTPTIALLSTEISGVPAAKIAERFANRSPDRAVVSLLVTLRCDSRTVVDGLMAGAVDVLVLPMSPDILRAKLDFAHRLIRRFETIASGGEVEETHIEATPSNVRVTASTLGKKYQTIKAFSNAGASIVNAISGLGLDDVVGAKELIYPEREPTFAMWCTVVAPASALWVDVLVESDRKSAMLLFQKLTGMPASSGKDALDTIGEVVNIVQGAIKSGLQAEGHEVITPIVPRAVPTANLPKLNEHMVDRVRVAVDAGGIALSVTLYVCSRSVVRKTVENLRAKDVTVEALSMPGMDLKLLNRGVMLDDRAVNALRDKLTGDARRLVLNVLEAPALLDLLRSA